MATTAKHTVGAPVALRMKPITGPGGLRANGSDVVLIDVEAVDAKGDRCPTFQQRVDFEVEGPGVWRGGYNSGKIKSTNNTYLDLEAGINRVAVRSTRTPGTITVRVNGAGLKPASIVIASAAVNEANGYLTELPELPAVNPANFNATSVVGGTISQTVTPPAKTGKFTKAFSYSGPTISVHLESDAQDGKKIYVDANVRFATLPPGLKGADYVQLAAADKAYSAVDLIQIAVKAGTVVSIAHDDRLLRPAWLTGQFEATPLSVTVDGKPMKVFQRRAAADESITLGSNVETQGSPACNMYLVFVGSVPAG